MSSTTREKDGWKGWGRETERDRWKWRRIKAEGQKTVCLCERRRREGKCGNVWCFFLKYQTQDASQQMYSTVGKKHNAHAETKPISTYAAYSWTVSKIIAQVNKHLCVPWNVLYYVDTILLHNFYRSLIATPFSKVYAQFMWIPFSHREISKERTWSKCADLSLFPHHQLVTADSCLSLSLVLPELSSC